MSAIMRLIALAALVPVHETLAAVAGVGNAGKKPAPSQSGGESFGDLLAQA